MRSLRIALTVDPELPVPPQHYGGIERIVAMLVEGLSAKGHEITLFAHPDSRVPCRLAAYPARRSQARADLLHNSWHVGATLLRERFDLIHSFGRLAYLLPALPFGTPKLMSYQRQIAAGSVRRAEQLARGTLHFSGCSRSLIAAYAERPNWHVVYNGVSAATYTPRTSVAPDAPLVFLGRVEAIKGPHLAIEVARRTGRKLIIAGNVAAEHQAFFDANIAPQLDNSQIRFVGPVDDRQKNELLGAAAALLMPVLWDEPFGIVMAEALACGTPVLGFNRGAVGEVVEHGVSGFVCATLDELAAAAGRLAEIDRCDCRQAMEQRFSERVIVQAYERLYQRLLPAHTA